MLIKSEKKFKVMDWLRATRDSIYEETKNFNSEELIAYFQKGSEQFCEQNKKRQILPRRCMPCYLKNDLQRRCTKKQGETK